MTSTATGTKTRWGTQTGIGQRYGLTAVAVGKILTRVGLKQGLEATGKALLTGHARKSYTKDERAYFMWDMELVGEIIEEALVLDGGPKIDLLLERVGKALADLETHRAEGNDWFADLLEEEALSDIPPGLVRVLKRKLNR